MIRYVCTCHFISSWIIWYCLIWSHALLREWPHTFFFFGEPFGVIQSSKYKDAQRKKYGVTPRRRYGFTPNFQVWLFMGLPPPKIWVLGGGHDSMSVGTFDMSLEHASQTIACRQGMETSPPSSSQLSCRAHNQLLLPSQRPSSSETISSFQPESILLSHWSH